MTKSPAAVDALTYEQSRDELVDIVGKLETGAATLDESMSLWERGETLARRCEELLDGAQQAIEKATSTGTDTDD